MLLLLLLLLRVSACLAVWCNSSRWSARALIKLRLNFSLFFPFSPFGISTVNSRPCGFNRLSSVVLQAVCVRMCIEKGEREIQHRILRRFHLTFPSPRSTANNHDKLLIHKNSTYIERVFRKVRGDLINKLFFFNSFDL